jgi:membrane-bound lytic murein transglycosylase A
MSVERSRGGDRVRGTVTRVLAAVAAVGLLAWAPGAHGTGALRALDPTEIPTLLDDGDLDSLRRAVRQSLVWLGRQPPGRTFTAGTRALTAAEQARGLRQLLDLLADEPAPEVLEARVLAEFDVLTSVGHVEGRVLHTGYHEPVVEAAAARSPAYPVPILGLAGDGPGPVPWLRGAGSRAEIEAGRLDPSVRALAWARDAVDVFFMEIEGSGTLRFPDGREVRVGPAATNGRPYRSIGRLLVDEGHLPEEAVSMRAIRAWLRANPAQQARVLRHNEAVVFFRTRTGEPRGSLGVPLTPGRSIATDARLFPAGALAFVRTERPVLVPGGQIVWVPVSRLVLNQDTGGAIRGPGRVDLFWGRGPEAEVAASEMKQVGELHFLVPRARAPRGRADRL